VTTFAVYADCAVGMRPSVDEQVRFAEELPDPAACVWLDGAGEAVVKASFDLSATGFEDAVARGRKTVAEALGRAGLAGMVVALTAMTEEGQARWTADDTEDT
jgi:hypothetical protein